VRFSEEFRTRRFEDDRAIIDRIIAAHHAAKREAESAREGDPRSGLVGGIWGAAGFDGKQGTLLRALEDRDAAAVHRELSGYFRSEAAHGIAMGAGEHAVITSDPVHAASYGRLWVDRLFGLAAALGVVPLPNPEDSPDGWERFLAHDPEPVAEAVEARLGVRLEFPDCCGVFGGEWRGRPLPFITLPHLLSAVTARDLLALSRTGGAARPVVVEIGGGFGGLAMWLARLLPAVRHEIYDLPFAVAVQAYFLSRAMPERSLALCGEPAADAPGSADFTLLPAWRIHSRPETPPADAAINTDSLAEIPRGTAVGYFRSLRRFLRGPLLSINHESPARDPERWGRSSASEAASEAGGWVRLSRSPFFLRLGYVQEVFLPDSVVPSPGFAQPPAPPAVRLAPPALPYEAGAGGGPEEAEIRAMFEDLARAPAVYRPGKFWEYVAACNVQQLRLYGRDNFKRTLALSYFTWIAPRRDEQFAFLRSALSTAALAAAVGRTLLRALRGPHRPLGWRASAKYDLLTRMVWDYAERTDTAGVMRDLAEPAEGNPPRVRRGGRLISQDLANSALEFRSVAEGVPDLATGGVRTILELGAGYGRTAFVFLKRLPAVRYIVADIPPALHVAQDYLTRLFPDRPAFRWRPFRDYAAVREEFEAARLAFLLPHQLELLPDRSADLFVNISSLHEMRPEQIAAYFGLIDRLVSRWVYLKQWKRHVNSADGVTVTEADYPIRPHWRTALRRTCAVQTGFFEAVFDVRG
jgi:putative sugar O-methyltransferase